MTTGDDPAFPVTTGDPYGPWQNGHTTEQFPGLSIRDFFAVHAMATAMSGLHYGGDHIGNWGWATSCARYAYELADAMIREREKHIQSQAAAAAESEQAK